MINFKSFKTPQLLLLDFPLQFTLCQLGEVYRVRRVGWNRLLGSSNSREAALSNLQSIPTKLLTFQAKVGPLSGSLYVPFHSFPLEHPQFTKRLEISACTLTL